VPTNGHESRLLMPADEADSDALIERVGLLPEAEALAFYSQLSPKLQWLARKRATGERRNALMVHHAITFGPCR
jgi:hypothetical protein